MSMRVLVAYGSKMGGTKGLAEMVGAELENNGFHVDVMPARSVRDVADYEGVIVGGALYSLRWHKDARRFMKQHRSALRAKPVFLFSSGPLDDSAHTQDLPPVRFVRKHMRQTHARGHITFGGRMPAAATGFPAASMARDNPGDWRDPDRVRMWAKQVAEDLHAG
ncbi:MAG: flavodoxin [Acidimicrobiia bacterium]|nr:flavodoxin [Acidimicrobiia bacterium]